MLCPICHGTRFAVVNGQRLPCPECGGYGEIHCCDGLAEQPDTLGTGGPGPPPAGREPDGPPRPGEGR